MTIGIFGLTIVPEFSGSDPLPFYFLGSGLLLLGIVGVWRLSTSRLGWVFRSLRQNEDLATSIGINVAKYRVMAFAVCCFMGGIGGAFFAAYHQNIYPASYTIADSVNFMLYCFLGGLDYILGPVYLFPQLTMGLVWFLVYWKWRAFRTGEEKYNQAARFWAKIFGVNFAVGVVTGMPMEFQFGTNWAEFSRYAGGVIGQTLAMEGMFAFFLESAFVGALIWGEKRLGPRNHFLAAVAVALGSWTSGYFILVTNAFMQHPVGYEIAPDGSLGIASLWAYLLNPWAWIQFAHNQTAAVVTGSFVIAAVGALYALRGVHPTQARLFLGAGTFVGLIASVVVAFPTGDQQARTIGHHQPVTLAAMEGRFVGGPMAGVAVIGQPNIEERRLDNPIEIPGALSFLAYGTFKSYVHGLGEYPQDTWPDNVALLYYSFHLMITLGTIFIVIMVYANFELWRGRLELNRWLLWVLVLAFPFPYIANTLGWMTAELGRQPWLVYGLFHTRDGYSKVVSSGDTIFTLIGFTGLYFVLGLLFLYLVGREIGHGPDEEFVVSEGKAPTL